jgi:hypothetical protein
MTFDQQYYLINDQRLSGKLLREGQMWQDYAEDRKKLAPIDRLDGSAWYGTLQSYNISISFFVRDFYAVRKTGKKINTVDAYEHFRKVR